MARLGAHDDEDIVGVSSRVRFRRCGQIDGAVMGEHVGYRAVRVK